MTLDQLARTIRADRIAAHSTDAVPTPAARIQPRPAEPARTDRLAPLR